MPSIVDILRGDPEPLPEWLTSQCPPRFDREAFFGSRTVYYPGSGDDGQPVKLCALSRASHCFIYVDQAVSRETADSYGLDGGFLFYLTANPGDLTVRAVPVVSLSRVLP